DVARPIVPVVHRGAGRAAVLTRRACHDGLVEKDIRAGRVRARARRAADDRETHHESDNECAGRAPQPSPPRDAGKAKEASKRLSTVRRTETYTRRVRRGSALGELRRLARALETRLLALLRARIAREQAGLAQRLGVVLVDLEQRARDAVRDRADLAGDAATLDLDHRVELPRRVRDAERGRGP